MATSAEWAFGTKLYRKNPDSGDFEAVPQIKLLSAPEFTQEYDDISNHDSPGAFREYIKTFKAPKEMPVEIVWDPAIDMHRTLYDDALAKDLRTWKIILPNARASAWTFDAFVSGFALPLPIDKGLVVTTSLRISSVPTPAL